MCGIAGILRITPAGEEARAALARPVWESIPERWLDILDDSIKHRGPDGAGRFRDRVVRADGCVVDVALVHRRLAIIDLADGHQPMVSLGKGRGVVKNAKRYAIGDGLGLYEPGEYGWLQSAAAASGERRDDPRNERVAVVFNGCIYNHRELRKELQAAGHVFSTDHSDTEVLVHGWREWGAELPKHLDGMLALAIWDATSGTVSCFRDVFGEKPLYSMRIGNFEAYSSCVPGLMQLRSLLPGADGGSPIMPEALRGWVQFGWNQITPYSCIAWQPFIGACTDEIGHAALNPTGELINVDEVDEALRRSVRARLDSDVPLACFLSGGIDSALIAKYAADERHDLDAYTVRMPSATYDESHAAARTARHLGISHTVLDCNANPAADVVALIRQLGLPFGDSSLLPATWVSRAARGVVRVALSGDGGDDLFLGYQRQQALPWLHRLQCEPPELTRAISTLVPPGSPKSRREKLRRLADAARFGGYRDLLAIFPPPLSSELGLEPPHTAGRWRHILHFGLVSHPSDDPLFATRTALRFDRFFYLPEDLMRKSDTASMSCALEVRTPMLSRELAAMAVNAPIECLMPGGQRKGLLRAVARKYFPPEIVDRPKMGFAIPVGEWFRTNYGGMRDLLLDHLSAPEPFGPDSLGINSMINMEFVRTMLKEHDDAGEKSPWPWKGRDHSQRLYMLLVLSIWGKWMGSLSEGRI